MTDQKDEPIADRAPESGDMNDGGRRDADAQLPPGYVLESRPKGTRAWRLVPSELVLKSLAPAYADLGRAFRQLLEGEELESGLADFRVRRC